MTSCDAELAFLNDLAEAAGIPVEEKKEDADEKAKDQPGAPNPHHLVNFFCFSASAARSGPCCHSEHDPVCAHRE